MKILSITTEPPTTGRSGEREGEREGNIEVERLSSVLVDKLTAERENKLKSLSRIDQPLQDEEAVKLGTALHSPLSEVIEATFFSRPENRSRRG